MVHVVVPDEPTQVTFVITTSSAGPFAFDFSYFDVGDVEVYDENGDLIDAADYTLTPTVSADGGYEGGSILLDVAVANTTRTVLRNVPIERTTDFPTSGRFPINTLNSWIDKVIAILQQLSSRITRTLSAPTTDPTDIDMELPAAATRATKVLAFDVDGNPTVSTLTLAVLEAQPAGAAASALAAAASATAAQTAETNAETAEAAAEAAQAAAQAAAASVPSFPIDPNDTTFAATKRVLGRNTTGAGTGEEVTLSQLLDWIGSAAQGDILYRGASAWARLAAGTSGHFLKTLGAGADPAWAAPSTVTKFTSTDQTITSAGALTLAHGLGAAPFAVQVELVCQSTEGGYSVNDVVVVNPHEQDQAGAGSRGTSIVADATNLNVRFGSAAGAFGILNKTTGSAVTLTNSNWKARFKAWV